MQMQVGRARLCFRLGGPLLDLCCLFEDENRRWPNSREELVSFDLLGSRHFAELPRSKRRALSALDWQSFQNLTFAEEGNEFRITFDYRDGRRTIDGITLGVAVLHGERRWQLHNPRMQTDVSVKDDGGDEGE